jgi:hypothetical protein
MESMTTLAMSLFNVVTLLENTAEDMKNKLDTFLNTTTDDNFRSVSNNLLKKWPSYEAIVTESNEQRELFDEPNKLDLEFYDWVKEELIR